MKDEVFSDCENEATASITTDEVRLEEPIQKQIIAAASKPVVLPVPSAPQLHEPVIQEPVVMQETFPVILFISVIVSSQILYSTEIEISILTIASGMLISGQFLLGLFKLHNIYTSTLLKSVKVKARKGR